jgi:mannose-6-phosphate isomerase-like protein (cupin superfamily)
MKESRPWGWYEVLHDGDYKIKRILVRPQNRLSLQSHVHRCEHWVVVRGQGKAVRDDDIIPLFCGKVVVIEKGQKHRLVNDSADDLEIVEIQTGDYFGEDDITRYEDDFGRA